jgi:hypothetical protein
MDEENCSLKARYKLLTGTNSSMAFETPLKRQSNCKVSTWGQQLSANQLLDRTPQLARGAKVDIDSIKSKSRWRL